MSADVLCEHYQDDYPANPRVAWCRRREFMIDRTLFFCRSCQKHGFRERPPEWEGDRGSGRETGMGGGKKGGTAVGMEGGRIAAKPVYCKWMVDTGEAAPGGCLCNWARCGNPGFTGLRVGGGGGEAPAYLLRKTKDCSNHPRLVSNACRYYEAPDHG